MCVNSLLQINCGVILMLIVSVDYQVPWTIHAQTQKPQLPPLLEIKTNQLMHQFLIVINLFHMWIISFVHLIISYTLI